MQKNKFVFFGTPEVASKTLEYLKNAGYIPELVVTSTDKPKGRKMILTPSPVKAWAIENKIPYIQPDKISIEELTENLKDIDLFIVVAYGKILPENVIKHPRLGSINIHYSLLPKWRGASPVQAAILNGDRKTGVSIQQMEFKMDSGPIIEEEEIQINQNDTTEELRDKLVHTGGQLLVKTLPHIFKGNIDPKKQDESLATFCKKIKKEDGLVDLEKEDPETIYRKYKAYHEWPRTYFINKENKRFVITKATLEGGKFLIQKVIPEGKKETDFQESFL